MFNLDMGLVLLVRKNKPAWQQGRLNGVGGKIEGDEEPIAAMVREFREETGIETTQQDWRCFCLLDHSGAFIWFYVATSSSRIFAAPMETKDSKEPLVIINPRQILHHNSLNNLRWLLPLAMDPDKVYARVLDTSTPWTKPHQ
jgi:8-oxo-dGTP diphosphatase